jgi:hypothetical protein
MIIIFWSVVDLAEDDVSPPNVLFEPLTPTDKELFVLPPPPPPEAETEEAIAAAALLRSSCWMAAGFSTARYTYI